MIVTRIYRKPVAAEKNAFKPTLKDHDCVISQQKLYSTSHK